MKSDTLSYPFSGLAYWSDSYLDQYEGSPLLPGSGEGSEDGLSEQPSQRQFAQWSS